MKSCFYGQVIFQLLWPLTLAKLASHPKKFHLITLISLINYWYQSKKEEFTLSIRPATYESHSKTRLHSPYLNQPKASKHQILSTWNQTNALANLMKQYLKRDKKKVFFFMELLTISIFFDFNMDLLFICRMDQKRNNFVWKITINKKQNEMIDDILQKSTNN